MNKTVNELMDHRQEASTAANLQYGNVLSAVVSDSSVSKKNTPKKSQLKKGVTRALKACSTCRKQKTRCFPSHNSIGCLRCSSMGLICSFEREALANNNISNGPADLLPPISNFDEGNKSGPPLISSRLAPKLGMQIGSGLVDARLKVLQNDVSEILQILRRNNDDQDTNEQQQEEAKILLNVAKSNDVTPLTDISKVKLFQYGNSVVDLNNLPSFGVPSSSFSSSPFKTFSDTCSSVKVSSPITRIVRNEKLVLPQVDVVSLGILSYAEAIDLLQNFRDRYGRWVSFPDEISTEELLNNIRGNCSLLLTSCCCLSLKYGNASLKQRSYQKLLGRLRTELSENIIHIPQTIEFLQSLVVLSFYGITLSTPEFNIDSWYISGIGLKQFLSLDLSGELFGSQIRPLYYDNEFYELTVHRIWNHLALAHVVYCLFTGRMCIIDELRLTLSRKILELSNSTNFDGRIVAEISSQLIVYNFIQFTDNQQSLPLVKEELKNWFDQWSYLFEQPANQFVELGYHYGYLLILYNWNFTKLKFKGDSQEILLNADSISMRSMIFHCQKIVEAMLDTPNDSYFAFLSDQVHFSANYGITMLIRILYVINLQSYNNDGDSLNKVEMSKNELHKNVSNCLKLANRYKKISTGDSDVFMKYYLTISELMTELFPGFS